MVCLVFHFSGDFCEIFQLLQGIVGKNTIGNGDNEGKYVVM